MNRLLIALCCVLSFAIPALAAPGEPRFLQGTVEWPAALNGEPVMIVRGDDGRVYAVDVSGARRQGAEAVRVGGRVAVLVIEGARAYDVTASLVRYRAWLAIEPRLYTAVALLRGRRPTMPVAG